tara:strand:- start:692 stop:922 length:231 start_codon:yes stop_codon:yes gene_type:complete
MASSVRQQRPLNNSFENFIAIGKSEDHVIANCVESNPAKKLSLLSSILLWSEKSTLSYQFQRVDYRYTKSIHSAKS